MATCLMDNTAFGINSADDLPKIREVLNQEIIEATKIEGTQNEIPVEVETMEEQCTEDFLESENKTGEAADTTETISE